MIIVLLVLLGLVLGSFANAAIWRLHAQDELAEQDSKRSKKPARSQADLSIVTGRSMCTHCGHVLGAKDLVPVLSYVWLRGRCRYCGKPIEDTPVAELLTPLLFVVSYVWWPWSLSATSLGEGWLLFGLWLVFLVGFVVLALYDLRWLLLPDRVVFPLIALALLQLGLRAVVFHDGATLLLNALWGVAVIAGLFESLYVISRQRWIGFGDVKLAIVLGLLVGGPWPAVLVIFMASLLGSLAALPLLVQGKSMRQTHIPFGPFLLAAAVAVLLWGSSIISWYTGLLVV